MKEYFINFALNAIASFLIAIVSFLIGSEVNTPSYATAMAAGIFSGIGIACSYTFGRMVGGKGFDGKILAVQIIAAVLFGLFGGYVMTL